ncbi:MAG: caspase family protein [Kofleriaceae bacterium]|nr:caspase family protein [Kofleriaceae bacterium]
MLLLHWIQDACADTRRVAVVVGNNAGGETVTPLRYAETDAGKLARVLVELGGVKASDMFLLQGKSRSELRSVLQGVGRRVAKLQSRIGTRVVLLFYFSGHSDGRSIELGTGKVQFSDVKHWLRSTGAEVRILILDSCKSGSALRSKGGRKGPGFEIDLRDELATRGEAILVSSAADELALESSEIRASFFSHHLTTGLRGAADKSGDGLVTLTEAYQYAYARTVLASDSTLQGRQHPHYDYRLSGQGELVLTDLGRKTSGITLPPGFSRALIVDLLRDQVVAELSASSAGRLALPVGKYALQVWKAGTPSSMILRLNKGEERRIGWNELQESKASAKRDKGSRDSDTGTTAELAVNSVRAPRVASENHEFSVGMAVGVVGGVSSTIPTLPVLQLSVEHLATKISGYVELARASGESHTETQAIAAARMAWDLKGSELKSFVAADLGLGFVTQTTSQMSGSSGLLMFRPLFGVRWMGLGQFVLQATGGASMMLL